jgi:hypothetical protein
MRSVKVGGTAEIQKFRERVRKAWRLNRISFADAKFLMDRCTEIESRIKSMHEIDEKGKTIE